MKTISEKTFLEIVKSFFGEKFVVRAFDGSTDECSYHMKVYLGWLDIVYMDEMPLRIHLTDSAGSVKFKWYISDESNHQNWYIKYFLLGKMSTLYPDFQCESLNRSEETELKFYHCPDEADE